MITSLFICIKICVQEIRKEEKLQNQEDNDQFDDDDSPELFTHGHVSKTMVIKEDDITEDSSQYIPDYLFILIFCYCLPDQ